MKEKTKTKFKETEIGKIPEGWKLRTLGDCCKLVKKQFKPSKGDKRKYIGLEHIEQQSLRLVGIGSSENVESNKFEFKQGQILFGKLRPYFRKVYRPKFDGVCSTDIWVIDTQETNDPAFFFYFFADERIITEANNSSEGTRMPRARWDYLEKLEFPIPSPSEQQSIAKILSDLDSKIELNQQMNKTLEEMGRAIFKRWFVDFEFPNEEGKPYKSSGGDMVYNEKLGKEIPKGWEVGNLRNFVELNPESWSKNTAPQEVNYVDLSNTKWGKIEETQRYSWREAPSRAQRVLRPGDTIIGTVRPGNGSFALVSEAGLTGSTGFAVLRPHKEIYEEYTYLVATSSDNILRLSHLADGAAYPAVRPEVVLETQAVKPEDSLLERFSHAAKPIMAKIANNDSQSRNLAALRDALLPKLMSGKIRVPVEAQ